MKWNDGTGRAGVGNKMMFARPAAAQRASQLLGVSLEDLAQFAFHATPATLMNGRSSFRTGSSPVADHKILSDKNVDPMEALEGFAQGLYVEAFTALVALINKWLSPCY